MSACGASDQGQSGVEAGAAARTGWGPRREGATEEAWPQGIIGPGREACLWHPRFIVQRSECLFPVPTQSLP